MKRVKMLLSFVFFLSTGSIIAQTSDKTIPDGIYYVVRHAEKDTGKNPALTAAGYLRAGDLYRELKNKHIGRIYFTEFRRTKLTGDSLMFYQKIDTFRYVADTTGDDVFNRLSRYRGKQKNALVIGHSNTIPAILKRLGISGLDISELPENEFDNLFVITIKKKKVSLKWLKYGNSPQAAKK